MSRPRAAARKAINRVRIAINPHTCLFIIVKGALYMPIPINNNPVMSKNLFDAQTSFYFLDFHLVLG
jgi:hypothetical protein